MARSAPGFRLGDVRTADGVAYPANVGGLITGVVLVRLFSIPGWVGRLRARLQPPSP
jgi:membrane associated rhomboid family serine protease